MDTKKTFYLIGNAVIRESPDRESKEVAVAEFGHSVTSVRYSNVVNGRIYVHYRLYENNSSDVVRGWIPLKALTEGVYKDYAGLYFFNGHEKKVPVTAKYRKEVTDYILPGERVRVIASFGEWCFTSKGWTKFQWLSKDREIFDPAVMDILLSEVKVRAIKDYKLYFDRIVNHKYDSEKDFCELYNLFEEIMYWFESNEYKLLFDENGENSIDQINTYLGIDDNWIREMERKRNRLRILKPWKKKE